MTDRPEIPPLVSAMRIPEHLRHPGYTDGHSVAWDGDRVEIWFWRRGNTALDPEYPAGEVVGHVFMTREHFENLPETLAKMIEMRRLGDESPE